MQPKTRNDPVLLDYLEAADESNAGSALEDLIRVHVQPVIHGIVHRRLRVGSSADSDITSDQAADMTGEITLKLFIRLRELKSFPSRNEIENFRGYVAVSAYYACDTHLRGKYPRRHSLKNQLRYILTHRDGFEIWQNEQGNWTCGFAAWQKNTALSRSGIQELIDRPEIVCEATGTPIEKFSPPDLLAAIFDYIGGPVNIDDLVSIVAVLWQIKDVASELKSIDSENINANLVDFKSTGSLDSKMDHRSHLLSLWAEIRELPLRQRIALLMGLRDGNGQSVLALLPLVRIASVIEIAETLEMSAESLADYWNKLPLPDSAIAEFIGASRQQVINLRKSARERLLRRTRVFIE